MGNMRIAFDSKIKEISEFYENEYQEKINSEYNRVKLELESDFAEKKKVLEDSYEQRIKENVDSTLAQHVLSEKEKIESKLRAEFDKKVLEVLRDYEDFKLRERTEHQQNLEFHHFKLNELSTICSKQKEKLLNQKKLIEYLKSARDDPKDLISFPSYGFDEDSTMMIKKKFLNFNLTSEKKDIKDNIKDILLDCKKEIILNSVENLPKNVFTRFLSKLICKLWISNPSEYAIENDIKSDQQQISSKFNILDRIGLMVSNERFMDALKILKENKPNLESSSQELKHINARLEKIVEAELLQRYNICSLDLNSHIIHF